MAADPTHATLHGGIGRDATQPALDPARSLLRVVLDGEKRAGLSALQDADQAQAVHDLSVTNRFEPAGLPARSCCICRSWKADSSSMCATSPTRR